MAPRLLGMKGTIGVVVTLTALLIAAGAVAWWGWNQLADVEMGIHGYIALALGVIATLGLGMGLMWLVYYSDRQGFDDEAGRE